MDFVDLIRGEVLVHRLQVVDSCCNLWVVACKGTDHLSAHCWLIITAYPNCSLSKLVNKSLVLC